MADKQYYVKVSFEWGVDDNAGNLTPKTQGGAEWTSMGYDDSVGLQTFAIIPAINDMLTKSGELGVLASNLNMPGKK